MAFSNTALCEAIYLSSLIYIYVGFVDFTKAFDLVEWNILFKILEETGIQHTIPQIVQHIHRKDSNRVENMIASKGFNI